MYYNIFETANNERFFDILTGLLKQLYWNAIMSLHEEIEKSDERHVSRTKANIILTEVLEEYHQKDASQFDMRPHDLFRRFTDCGWLVQKYNGELNDDFFSFTSFALKIINMGHEVEEDAKGITIEDFSLSLNRTVADMLNRNITSDCYMFPFRSGVRKIERLLNDAFKNLHNVNLRSIADVQNILNVKERDELMQMLINYLEDLNDGYLKEVLKSFDLTDICKQQLLKLINEIRQDVDLHERVIDDMRDYYLGQNQSKDINELEDILNNMLNNMYVKIKDEYQKYKRRIDDNIAEALNSALSKMCMLGTGSTSLLSMLEKILAQMAECGDEKILNEIKKNEDFAQVMKNSVNMMKIELYGEESLAKPRRFEVIGEMEPVKVVDDLETFDVELFINKSRSVKTANECVEEILTQKDKLKANEMSYNDESMIDKLMTIWLYVDDRDACYDIEVFEEKIVRNGYEFNNFEIRRKNK